MADYGIKISTAGNDVHTAEDRDIVYSSKWKSMKIFKEGSGTSDGAGQATIAHGLDFVPAFMVYDDDNWKGAGYYGLNHTSYINSTNLQIETANDADYAYKVFANPISGTSSLKPSTYDYGAKISEPGQNPFEAKYDELELLSSTGTFQIWETVTFFVDTDTDDAWAEGSLAHSFDFVPAYIGWVAVQQDQVSSYYLVGKDINAAVPGTGKGVDVEVVADNSDFYMRIYPNSTPEVAAGALARVYLLCYEKLI